MERIRKELEEKQKYYQTIMKKAQESLKKAPVEGWLRAANRKGRPQYYLITDRTDTKGKYLPQDEQNIAKKIAQRDYDEAVVRLAASYCKKIEHFLNSFPKDHLNSLHLRSPGRAGLIEPYELSDEEYAAQWQSVAYEGKKFEEDIPEIYTNKGERVRSKSEKIIADKLNELGIPYRYEFPVYLKGYGNVYPDFLLLNVSRRKEIILEHLGMMDQSDYSARAVAKIRQYEWNGFLQGESLPLTYETSMQPLDSVVLEKLLRKYVM